MTHLLEVVSKIARIMSVVLWAEELINCSRVLKGCLNKLVLFNLEYFAPMCMSSLESHLSLLNRVLRSAERFREGEFFVWDTEGDSDMCLLCKIYHRVDYPLHEYLHHFVAARTTKVSAALGELALVIPRCRIDQFRRLFLLAPVLL